METIRIVKQKRGFSKILWILVVLIIFGVIAWLTVDRNDQFNDAFFSEKDTLENNEYSIDEPTLAENQQVNLPAYLSFINRQVIPADSVSKEIKQKAAYHLRLALAEVDAMSANTRGEYPVDENDSVADKKATVEYNQDTSKSSVNNKYTNNSSFLEAGIQLIYLQKNEYPVLSKIGEKIQESIISLEKSENQEELKKFFVLSSSLLQEINTEEFKNQYVERGNYENYK